MSNSVSRTRAGKTRGKPSTLEILGLSGTKPVPAKWAEHHRRLTGLRQEILDGRDAQSRSAQEELSSFSEHMADAATDSYDRDCALALLSSAQEALYQIDQALARIADGTYGICELTGKPIERERLKTIPWTRFSLAAQAQLEARGMASRPQLGKLGSCTRALDSEEPGEEELEEVTTRRAEPEAA
jgi:RNA polymerase-binding transcription factor DksA